MYIKDFLEQQKISHTFHSEEIFEIEGFGVFLFLVNDGLEKTGIIDDQFSLCMNDMEANLLMRDESINYFCFSFGNKFYYAKVGEDLTLTPLEYIGKSTCEWPDDSSYLGIHTGFEICGAIGMPEKVVKKAKFLGIPILGISQRCTLNGVIDFQRECVKQGIKPILGMQIIVDGYEVILYAIDEKGWRNILNIHSQFSVFNLASITLEYLITKSDGIICILSNWYEFQNLHVYEKAFKENLYFKVDTVEWKNNERDKKQLLILQKYFKDYKSRVKPVLICESYYLEQYQFKIKKFLNNINKTTAYDSEQQYIKDIDVIYEEMCKLFTSTKEAQEFFFQAIEGTVEIGVKCNFQIALGQKYLPKYEMNEDEVKFFATIEDLFWDLIEKGLDKKVIAKDKDIDVYMDRVSMEYDVLKQGGVVDYFLILQDACRFMKENDILYGYGRGSAAGSVISYLFDLVKLDPIVFNLLFERFLNPARLQSSLPDIDTDIQSDRRDEVKEYFRQKYGKYRVAEVGNYQNIKLKSGITDIAKEFGLANTEVKFLTSLIKKEHEDGNVTDLFKLALKEEKIKDLIQTYPDIVEYLECIIYHPRSRGVHASATIIVPKDELHENFFDWAPTELIDGRIVTQWDGIQLEAIGYLKEDLLGLAQLDKFHDMIDLIKKNHGETILIEDVPLDVEEVYEYFRNGTNEDVFQFTSPSQKSYTKYLKPDNIEELIAANALYRPGPMDTGAHNTFVKIKFGEESPEYPPHLKDILEYTYGLFVYQEQTMQAFQKVTNASLVESDNFRKFVSKLMGDNQSNDKYLKYEKQFLDGYINNWKVPKDEAQYVWNKIVAFATYGFNRSHAAAYAITGYIAQWFKVHYPVEYWVTALNRSGNEKISTRLNEINKLKVVKVNPPDINFSDEKFTHDSNNNIYWAITTIKQAGEKSVEKLFNERKTNGNFFSFSEFYDRCKASKMVNKAVVLNLILCGCFDKLENIHSARERKNIVRQYEAFSSERFFQFDEQKYQYNYAWEMLTKNLCEFDNINYRNLLQNTIFKTSSLDFFSYYDIMEFENPTQSNTIITAGIIKEINPRRTKTGKRIVSLYIDQNNDFFNVILWNDSALEYKDVIDENAVGRIIYLSGRCALDTYRNVNSVYSTDKTKIQLL